MIPISIEGAVQNYAWGKPFATSRVAQLAFTKKAPTDEQKTQNFAELWMGTHKSGPSRLQSNPEMTLQQYFQSLPLDQQIKWFGERNVKVFGEYCSQCELPFLLKVLSVNQALSIQVHPNKTEAERLFKENALVYKDPCHKPEVCCALTNFEALCGFQLVEAIVKSFERVSQLKAVIQQSMPEADFAALQTKIQAKDKEVIRILFSTLMKGKPEIIQAQLTSFVTSAKPKSSSFTKDDALLLRLHETYPGDVGCFAVYFLNYTKLFPGEYLFLKPNEPHAYLSGDCIECMACSDNVIRAGLTPKFRDVDTLLNMLTYEDGSFKDMFLAKGTILQNNDKVVHSAFFPPPNEFKEFALHRIEIKKGKSFGWSLLSSISIMLVVEGTNIELSGEGFNQTVSKGDILAIPAGFSMSLNVKGEQDALVFIARGNL